MKRPNKTLATTAISAFALACSAPLMAQEEGGAAETAEEEAPEFLTEDEEAMAEFEREMADAFSLFGDLFKVDPLSPEQEALLPLAEQMANVIMPEGTFALVMQDTMKPMMDAMMSGIASDPRLRLGALTGIDSADLVEMDDTQAQEALDIFDPEFSQRNEKMGTVVVEMVGEMFNAIEPAYREGYARALTTRFDEAEMNALLEFFETPVGGKFATASFSIQYDPQMLGVMEKMGPAMVEVMPDMMAGFAELEAEFAKERKFGELSEAERERAAALLGKSVSELEALQPAQADKEAVEDASLYEEA